MKQILITMSLLAAVALPVAAQWDDDIYYNPKREQEKKEKARAEAMAADTLGRTDIDVDAYNMRGAFGSALTPIDTVGASVASGQDFVYSNQIQKFYNPTIIVDNAELLDDVLNNSYGNVSVVIENGVPVFDYAYASPYNWGWNFGWRYTNRFNPFWWGVSMGYIWEPGWIPGWGPAWAPGFDPFWSFGPAGWWRPVYNPAWTAHHYRPNGNQVNQGGRPGSSYRPGGYARPSYRPNASTAQGRPGLLNGNSTRTYRQNPGTLNSGNRGYRTNNNYSSPLNSNRNYGTNSHNSSNSSYRQNSNSNNGYQYRSNSSFGSGSRGSFGGGSRGGSSGGNSRGGSISSGRHR